MLTRRTVLSTLLPLGLASSTLARAIAQEVERSGEITAETLLDAEWISGVSLDEEQRMKILGSVRKNVESLKKLREISLDEQVPMALPFVPLKGLQRPAREVAETAVRVELPATIAGKPDDEQLAFLPVAELSELIRTRQVSSMELTKLYLSRLEKFDPVLKCVVNLTPDIAMAQAERADREIALGRYRGPLHGIPWGAKDLIPVKGYPVTWGIPDRREKMAERSCTIVDKLEEAGAVLVAKLSLGALAMGDQWFGGRTNSPWNPGRGSSGSSAGSAAAVVAGLCGFAMGTETLGSIVSPSVRCGTTSLRPTFGRISRDGCMPLSWTMDKLGPMARSVTDLAMVFGAVHGADGRDPSSRNEDFHWPSRIDLRRLRVGVPQNSLDDESNETISVLRDMGVELTGIELPREFPVDALLSTIDIESAAMFDTDLRGNKTEGWNQWPTIFRAASFIPAVDYIRMQRVRMQLMTAFEKIMDNVDFLVDANDLLITNLTGHPSVVLPRRIELNVGRFRPQSTVVTGHAYDDARLLTFARELEKRYVGGLEHPPMQRWLDEMKTPPEGEETEGGESTGKN